MALKFVPWRVQGQRLSFSMTVPLSASSLLGGEAGGPPFRWLDGDEILPLFTGFWKTSKRRLGMGFQPSTVAFEKLVGKSLGKQGFM